MRVGRKELPAVTACTWSVHRGGWAFIREGPVIAAVEERRDTWPPAQKWWLRISNTHGRDRSRRIRAGPYCAIPRLLGPKPDLWLRPPLFPERANSRDRGSEFPLEAKRVGAARTVDSLRKRIRLDAPSWAEKRKVPAFTGITPERAVRCRLLPAPLFPNYRSR